MKITYTRTNIYFSSIYIVANVLYRYTTSNLNRTSAYLRLHVEEKYVEHRSKIISPKFRKYYRPLSNNPIIQRFSPFSKKNNPAKISYESKRITRPLIESLSLIFSMKLTLPSLPLFPWKMEKGKRKEKTPRLRN